MNDGPDASIEPSVKDAHDRARDQAARRPAGRPPARARVARRRGRRVRPHRGHRVRRGHRRGGRRRDRRRDRPGRGGRPPAGQRRLVGARPRADHRPRRLRARAARGSDAYNSVGGFVFGELGRLPKRGDMVRANGYSLRVEAVRENRVEAVRIRDHQPRRARPNAAESAARARGARVRPQAAELRSVRESTYSSAEVLPMWCVKLSDSQRDAVRALIKAQGGSSGPSLRAALEALDYARWDDLPDAELPWDRVAELALRAGHRRGRRGLGPGRGHAVGKVPVAAQEPRRAGASQRASSRRSRRRTSCRACLLGELAHALGHLGADRLADRGRHVEAHEVEQRERAHRVAGAELHAGVDRLGREALVAPASAPRRTGRGRAAG